MFCFLPSQLPSALDHEPQTSAPVDPPPPNVLLTGQNHGKVVLTCTMLRPVFQGVCQCMCRHVSKLIHVIVCIYVHMCKDHYIMHIQSAGGKIKKHRRLMTLATRACKLFSWEALSVIPREPLSSDRKRSSTDRIMNQHSCVSVLEDPHKLWFSFWFPLPLLPLREGVAL